MEKIKKHTHIKLKRGHATFQGENHTPSKEVLTALKKMAEIAYNNY